MSNYPQEINRHLEIAEQHKGFITFLQNCVNISPERCRPNVFCVWITVASYYCAVHLLDALFEKRHKQTVTILEDDISDTKYGGYLTRLQLDKLKREYKALRRLVFLAKYLPIEPQADYDIVTDIELTTRIVVEGHLARIEQLVYAELNKP